MKLVEDLGEEVLPEPPAAPASDTTKEDKAHEAPHVGSVPLPNDPTVPPEPAAAPIAETPASDTPATPTPTASETGADQTPGASPTTATRSPMHIPDTVHVRITAENLKEYVGPPVYHQDRLYSKPPPAGVSTGLGYLGNGSGAVMPIEAMVSNLVWTGCGM